MTEALLDYLKSLCVSHTDFQHSEERVAYYEFDWTGMMSAGRRRNDVLLYVHKIQGKYNDNHGDYRTDTTSLAIIILKKVDAKSLTRSREQMLACKTYGEQFFARMRYDRQYHADEDVCKLLQKVLLDDIIYEQTELSNDGWIGVQFRLPFKVENTTQHDPDLWL